MTNSTKKESSTIKFVKYDEAMSVLTVGFRSGSVYEYHGVTEDVADAFQAADSMGSFFHSQISGKYVYEKLNTAA